MGEKEQIIDEIRKIALHQIEQYGLPHEENFFLTEKKGRVLGQIYNADLFVIHLGVMLMDIQLGYAHSLGEGGKHIEWGISYAENLLSKYELPHETVNKIIECIAKHHGAKEYTCTEAEICTNADCYRFLHPKGFFLWIATLGKRNLPFHELLQQAEYKLDEKYAALSLPECTQELTPFYQTFKAYIAQARSL